MKKSTLYRECHIQGESFQREKNGTWVSQYTVFHPEGGSKGTGFPFHQYQFNNVFPTESEADEHALQKAKEWIDKN